MFQRQNKNWDHSFKRDLSRGTKKGKLLFFDVDQAMGTYSVGIGYLLLPKLGIEIKDGMRKG
jgi:hypothetical protein